MRGFLHPEAVIRWHNSGEQFTAEEFIRANCEYPGAWQGRVERIVEADGVLITVVRVASPDGSQPHRAVSILEARDGLIITLDEYWGDVGEPPRWRRELGIGREISGLQG